MPPEQAAVHVYIQGRVQGVGYRYFVQETAAAYGLKGWVRNISTGAVECEAEGPRTVIENWIKDLRKGPPMARVEDVKVDWRPASRGYKDFAIRS